MNEGGGVLLVPRQPMAAVSPCAAYSTPVMGIPTPSPFSFSVASTRWSSSRPYNHVFSLVLRAMVMVFSFGSSLALAVTMSNNSQQEEKGFQDFPELVYSFAITTCAFIYSVYQLFKGIFDIAFKGIFISDKTSEYTSFILDQFAGYLLVSSSSVTALMINQPQLSGNTSLKKAAVASVCMSVVAFLSTVVCAILSGYKLSKRIMW
ncbi:hypothetical protein L1987_59994 [Smallanthus sonchifolius]|uniref:Uncharacterized protein n=1 Tax=Smallanthus sonchifolius TaxID=185202 RepID=A0ACB9D6T8_9ASTR|nr:hypothetical protein L1987_59994 [Smallanthus sonchifolius]